MNRDELLTILAEFFRDTFADDPIGVGDWFAQNGDDIDAFVAVLNKECPKASP